MGACGTYYYKIDKENKAIKAAKEKGEKYQPFEHINGDTPKQLLARSRYIIAKSADKWTNSQKDRAIILFETYPQLKKYYEHTIFLRSIYEQTCKIKAEQLLHKWIKKTFDKEYELFYTCTNSISHHLENILNFFNHRNTNANAESFNAKIKLFRANLRGVVDVPFFLFRMTKLFA